MVRHNTRPPQERNPPKFPGERFLTSVLTADATTINVIRTTDSSEVEGTKLPKGGPGPAYKRASHSGDRGDPKKEVMFPKIPNPTKRNAARAHTLTERCVAFTGERITLMTISPTWKNRSRYIPLIY